MSGHVPSVDEIARQEHAKFAETQRHVVEQNPTCQACGIHPSTTINRWGRIKAVCRDCLNDEIRRFEDACKEQDRVREEVDRWEQEGYV